MYIHSKTDWGTGGIFVVCAILIFIQSATANKISYGRTFQLPIGTANEKVWTIAEIFVPSQGTIIDIDLAIDISHSSARDLQIYLQSPEGKSVSLNYYDVYGFIDVIADYRMTIFDDEATTSIQDGPAGFEGIFRPKDEGALSTFDGDEINGIWQVKIYDGIFGHIGTLNNIRLDIEYEPLQSFSSSGIIQLTPIPEPNSALLIATFAMLMRVKRKSWLICSK